MALCHHLCCFFVVFALFVEFLVVVSDMSVVFSEELIVCFLAGAVLGGARGRRGKFIQIIFSEFM